MTHNTIIPCELWHRILGHLHFRALPGLQRMVKGMPSFDYVHDIVCRGCALGKNVKNKCPSIINRFKGIIYLVHSDVCGPMYSPSLCGHLHYVLFIDDFSCKA